MRQPTQMPEWLEKQFENAERTVQTWSEGKREAAGIPSDPKCSGLPTDLRDGAKGQPIKVATSSASKEEI